jgi:2-oxoglutarate ferredoxin oxidoreductase subunit gamma
MPEVLWTPDRMELRISGSGGQGVLLAAAILAEAATALGRHVVQTQSYGPAARGGASRAEVIVSVVEIDYLVAKAPHVSLCLSQEAYDKYAGSTRAGGLVVYDSGLVDIGPGLADRRMRGLPFAKISREQLGQVLVANIVALGALVGVIELLPAEAVEKAVQRRVPAKFRELNTRAFRLGGELAASDASPEHDG